MQYLQYQLHKSWGEPKKWAPEGVKKTQLSGENHLSKSIRSIKIYILHSIIESPHTIRTATTQNFLLISKPPP